MLVDEDRSIRVVAENLFGPNGTVITPDHRTLIVAESHAGRLTAFSIADDGSLTDRRLFATVNEAAARYPSDPEVWYVVGEARFHHGYGSMFDMSEPEVRDAFNRSVGLDSAFDTLVPNTAPAEDYTTGSIPGSPDAPAWPGAGRFWGPR